VSQGIYIVGAEPRSGFPMKQESAEGVVHVTLSLTGELSDE
jgi:hypothetical protein